MRYLSKQSERLGLPDRGKIPNAIRIFICVEIGDSLQPIWYWQLLPMS
jgi:hypothetical protein